MTEAATPPRRERRRFGLTGAAAQSVFAARLAEPASDQLSKIRAAEAAMGGQRRMTKEAIEAELHARQTSRAWVFERRKGQMPRASSAEDAVILDD